MCSNAVARQEIRSIRSRTSDLPALTALGYWAAHAFSCLGIEHQPAQTQWSQWQFDTLPTLPQKRHQNPVGTPPTHGSNTPEESTHNLSTQPFSFRTITLSLRRELVGSHRRLPFRKPVRIRLVLRRPIVDDIATSSVQQCWQHCQAVEDLQVFVDGGISDNAIVDLFIPDWEGIQTGRSLFFTLAEASELLELINRDKCR